MNSISRIGRAVALLLVAACILVAGIARAEWVSAGVLQVPSYSYSFLAATPSGDLLAATFNTNPQTGSPAEIPALLVRNPASPAPQVVELCRTSFEPQRGYGGIASTASGAFFVSGDTGNVATAFIRKFNPDGTPDKQFGSGGEIRPGKRCLGIETFASYLLVAVDWGQVMVIDALNGANKGMMPAAPGTVYVRDIAMDPKSMRVFGVAAGGIVTWGQGSPWNPGIYSYRPIAPESTRARAGEGISFDPLRRTLLITPIPGNVLREIHGTGQSEPWTVSTASPDAHLCDSVMSFDGTSVYISDMLGRRVHRMKREVGDTGLSLAYARPALPATQTVAAPTWHRSYEEVVQTARVQNRPMFVYFRSGSLPTSAAFEEAVLRTDEFNRRAGNFVCVFEDVEKSRLLAHQFGVYRVPYVCVLDPRGETLAEFRRNVVPEQLYKAMDSVR